MLGRVHHVKRWVSHGSGLDGGTTASLLAISQAAIVRRSGCGRHFAFREQIDV
jgi:hypothetical protein